MLTSVRESHKETADHSAPTPYQLGGMYFKDNRAYNPYAFGTESYAEFERGYRSAKVKHDMALRRNQYHSK